MLFAALRFYKDSNISDRLYWYLAEFPVCAGEKVFAPVGTRNRLQKAIVERTVEAEKENAPYDIALVKKIEARCEVQRFELANAECIDLGGIRYDDRHYTHFYRVSFCAREELSFEEKAYLKERGLGAFIHTGEVCDVENGEHVLIFGADARDIAHKIIGAARGEEEELFCRIMARRLQ